MRTITGQLTPEIASAVDGQSVAKASSFSVNSLRDLLEHAARLAYLNKDYLLFFRGQDRNHQNKAQASTVYPSIYRGERVSQAEIELKFDILASASRRLCDALESEGITGANDVKRRRYIQWSILQHYEVCPTPLLDLTQSLRVACSFAFLSSDVGDPYVFVFGLPYITNRISINSEHDIVNVRLLSICPPDALRPYYQEGYLAGTDETTTDYVSKDELDFNNRLVAKFRLRRHPGFWGKGFGAIPKSALYPSNDRIEVLCKEIRRELGTEVEPGRLGLFLQSWTDLESIVLTAARRLVPKTYSLREGISVLTKEAVLPQELIQQLNELRRLRNTAVHEPQRLEAQELTVGIERISTLRDDMKDLDL